MAHARARARAPRCERCGREAAQAFAVVVFWHPDGTAAPPHWELIGPCTDGYLVRFTTPRGDGYCETAHMRENWHRHLAEKNWFARSDAAETTARADFFAAVTRYQAAGGTLRA
jgi:hypothetical protein